MVVGTFASAEEFLADGGGDPDCLILDIHLPGRSGLELARELRGHGRAVPVVFITARDEPGLNEQANCAGAVAFLLKPFPEEALLEAVARAVRAANRPRASATTRSASAREQILCELRGALSAAKPG